MPSVAERKDWTTGSRALLDLVTCLVGVGLVLLGVYMSVTDYSHELESTASFRVVGETAEFDPSYRLAFVPIILAIVAFLSFASVWRWFRARQSPRLRRHAGRFVGILAAGSGIADLAYFMDTSFGLTAPHSVRALVIDPLYVLAGVLVAASAWRIRSLILPLPPGDPEEVP